MSRVKRLVDLISPHDETGLMNAGSRIASLYCDFAQSRPADKPSMDRIAESHRDGFRHDDVCYPSLHHMIASLHETLFKSLDWRVNNELVDCIGDDYGFDWHLGEFDQKAADLLAKALTAFRAEVFAAYPWLETAGWDNDFPSILEGESKTAAAFCDRFLNSDTLVQPHVHSISADGVEEMVFPKKPKGKRPIRIDDFDNEWRVWERAVFEYCVANRCETVAKAWGLIKKLDGTGIDDRSVLQSLFARVHKGKKNAILRKE